MSRNASQLKIPDKGIGMLVKRNKLHLTITGPIYLHWFMPIS